MMTNSDPITNLFEPLKLTIGKGYERMSDLYSLINKFYVYDFSNNSLKINKFINLTIFASVFVFLNFIFIKMISGFNNELAKLSIICLIVLVFLPHARYDYILLLPLLILSIKNFYYLIFKVNIVIIIYYFYLNRLIKHLIDYDQLYDILIFLTFFAQLIINSVYLKKNNSILKI